MKKLLPYSLRVLNEYPKLLRVSWRDFRRYAKHACIGRNRGKINEAQLEGRIMATYHVLEKGLSMQDFRPCFGVPVVKGLIQMLREGADRFCWGENVNYQTAVKVVRAYMQRHAELGVDLDEHFSQEEQSFGKDIEASAVKAGSLPFGREGYFEKAHSEFSEFAPGRHSCRAFDMEREVDVARIKSAVAVARFAPSVCNRQCWRVHVFTERDKVQELLGLQGGNRGFGHAVPVVLVLTSRLGVFEGYLERNQAYIDGGLFAMGLMYGLHNQELGAVPLCWLTEPKRDDSLRAAGGIPEDEAVIMLMGVGVPVEEFSTPASQRRSVDDLVTIH